jgi:RNA polymerase sigma-70 factor (ECF subfamily)
MSDQDQQDIALCLDGHAEAYRRLVQRYQGPLVSYLRVRFGNDDRATETAQESLVRAYFALPRLKKRESFYPWLIGIAERVSAESARSESRERRALAERSQIAAAESPPDLALREAVDDLPDPYRTVLQLRYYGGLSCQEVALKLGLPLGTVTKQLSRAYALLRERVPQGSRTEDGEVHS